MVTHRTRWLVAFAVSGAVACSFGVDLDGLVGGKNSTPTNDSGIVDATIQDAPTTPEAATPSTAEIVSVGSGINFNCALKKDGTVNCWGRGTEGRLGSGTTDSSSNPIVVVNIDTATELAVGENHACVILQNGTVECWGQNDSKQLGNTTATNANSPTPVVGLTQNVKHIATGGVFSCAHLADDTAACWGDNQQGELGDGTLSARPGPVAVKGVSGIKQLVTTNASACALVSDGTVWCWGDNGNGEIAISNNGVDISTPTQVAGLTGITALAVGSSASHMCAVLGDTSVKCWGYGQTGTLGNNSTNDSATPVAAATVTGAVSVMMGNNFTCALHSDATVNCWGANQSSTLPVGDSNPPTGATTPLPAPDLTGVLALSGGYYHGCALKDAHTVLCWGVDQYGALGRKRPVVVSTPVTVASTTDVTEFGVGREFGCALRANGSVACWGNNYLRQQARTDFVMNGVPSTVTAIQNSTTVATGDTHACVVNGDAGTVQCWGEGDQGSLGNFQTNYIQPVPQTFASGASFDVGAGSNFTCALTKGNEVYCAGYAQDGRLGRSAGNSTSSPGPVVFPAAGDAGPSPLFANSISVGRSAACAIYSGKTQLACWGSNSDGQLGTGGGSRANPSNVSLPHPPTVVRMGYTHACAVISTTNDVYCWGRNYNGQLGGTDAVTNVAPRAVDLGGHTAKDLALGDTHTCAILDDDTVSCWGAGTLGQLGNGALADSATPVVATGVTGATAIRAAENHTCALTATGLMCWGSDNAGQLGVSTVMETGTPDAVQGL